MATYDMSDVAFCPCRRLFDSATNRRDWLEDYGCGRRYHAGRRWVLRSGLWRPEDG